MFTSLFSKLINKFTPLEDLPLSQVLEAAPLGQEQVQELVQGLA